MEYIENQLVIGERQLMSLKRNGGYVGYIPDVDWLPCVYVVTIGKNNVLL